MKISKIRLIDHQEEPVYCLNVEDHELIIKYSESKESYLTGNCNFSLEFGAAAYSFAGTLKSEWSLDETKKYVRDNNLLESQQKLFKTLASNIDDTVTDKKVFLEDQLNMSYYWAAAKDVREKFFETYSGLAQWHVSQHAFAKEHGYIQSLWGPIRRVPYLTYVGASSDKGLVKNQENIVLNSPVQNWEAMYMMYNMSRLHKDLILHNAKSYIVSNIHDSYIDYMHRSEVTLMKELSLKYFHEYIPELMLGVPYEIELGYSDYTKDEWWGVTEHEF